MIYMQNQYKKEAINISFEIINKFESIIIINQSINKEEHSAPVTI